MNSTSLSQKAAKRFSGKRTPKGSSANFRIQSNLFGINNHCRIFVPHNSKLVYLEIAQDGLSLGDRFSPVETYPIGYVDNGRFRMLRKIRSDRFSKWESLFRTADKCGVDIKRLLAIANKLCRKANQPEGKSFDIQKSVVSRKKKALSKVYSRQVKLR